MVHNAFLSTGSSSDKDRIVLSSLLEVLQHILKTSCEITDLVLEIVEHLCRG